MTKVLMNLVVYMLYSLFEIIERYNFKYTLFLDLIFFIIKSHSIFIHFHLNGIIFKNYVIHLIKLLLL